jgi:hypothetical protein
MACGLDGVNIFANFKSIKNGGNMFRPLDVKEELQEAKKKRQTSEDALIKEVHALLDEGKYVDEELLQRMKSSEKNRAFATLKDLNRDDIYTLEDISNICIRYRLRFLDTKYFKPEFPYEALAKVKALERANETKIERFRIIAPGEAFNLEDANKDPLLFAELADGRYYLLHKWGKDLAWYRRILTWPLQSLGTFFTTLVIFCAVLAFSLPKEMIVRSSELYEHIFEYRMMFMMHIIIGLFFFLVFIGMTFHKSFSSMTWDSKCFN